MGLFAKEAVVGTLGTLYDQIDRAAVPPTTGAADTPAEPFDLWGGIGEAVAAIPAGFEGFFDTLRDPLGLGGDAMEEVDVGTVHAMTRYFDGQIGALAYMLFILIYAPCVAAIAAIYRETNLNWTLFAVGYLTSLAWITSTLVYQLGTYARHPGSSAAWIAFALTALFSMYIGLKLRARTLTVNA
jgi:ferrous iron transport protein B